LSFARYGYSAMVVNEFAGRDIPCATEDLAVATTSCPFPGSEVIAGIGIYGVAENFWFNVCMTILLQIIFRVFAYIILRRVR